MRHVWFYFIFGFLCAVSIKAVIYQQLLNQFPNQALVSCNFHVENFKAFSNPGWGTASSQISNQTGEQLLNITFNLTKQMNFKIMV
jgi:hypothetical protein